MREASHGCIRVEHPDTLARFVRDWDDDRIQAAMHTGPDNQRVNLDAKLPVYIVYFTAYARDGTMRFADDIYRRDAVVMRAIDAGAFPTDEARLALKALTSIRSDASNDHGMESGKRLVALKAVSLGSATFGSAISNHSGRSLPVYPRRHYNHNQVSAGNRRFVLRLE